MIQSDFQHNHEIWYAYQRLGDIALYKAAVGLDRGQEVANLFYAPTFAGLRPGRGFR